SGSGAPRPLDFRPGGTDEPCAAHSESTSLVSPRRQEGSHRLWQPSRLPRAKGGRLWTAGLFVMLISLLAPLRATSANLPDHQSAPATALREPTTARDHWYIMQLQDKRAGWMRDTQ